MDTSPKTVGATISELRDASDMSRAEVIAHLADHGLSMQPTILWRIENGERAVRVDEAAALALVFDVSIEQLILGSTITRSADNRAVDIRREVIPLRKDVTEVLDGLDEYLSELEDLPPTIRVHRARKWLGDILAMAEEVESGLKMGPVKWGKRSDEAPEQQ